MATFRLPDIYENEDLFDLATSMGYPSVNSANIDNTIDSTVVTQTQTVVAEVEHGTVATQTDVQGLTRFKNKCAFCSIPVHRRCCSACRDPKVYYCSRVCALSWSQIIMYTYTFRPIKQWSNLQGTINAPISMSSSSSFITPASSAASDESVKSPPAWSSIIVVFKLKVVFSLGVTSLIFGLCAYISWLAQSFNTLQD